MATLFLVTGGGGFIGSTVVRELLELGHRVRVVDDFSTGNRSNLEGLDRGRLEIVEGSITDSKTCRRAAEGAERVIHLAAQISVPKSLVDPSLTHAINLDGTWNVFAAARDAGARAVVFASSCAVYGDSDSLPLTEDAPPRPLSPYAVTKLAGEQYGSIFRKLYRVPVCSFRFFNVFGPRQDPSSPYAAAVPIFLERMLRGSAVTVFGDGTQARDFIYVRDVALTLIHAALQADHVGSGPFNLASGKMTSLNELLREMGALVGTEPKIEYAAPRAGDIRLSLGSSARFIDVARGAGFEWRPRSLSDGLRETIAWFRTSRGS